MTTLNANQNFDRICASPESKKILHENERFSLKNKFYINQDQTIVIRSTFETGRIFKQDTNN